MTDLRKEFQERLDVDILPALRRATAGFVQFGLDLGEILSRSPVGDRAAAVAAISELTQQEGFGTITWAEAELLARLAARHPELVDPEQVDLNDPAVQEFNREVYAVRLSMAERDQELDSND